MPFPTFTPDTFEHNGSLPLDTYFNPSVNTNYRIPTSRDRQNGFVSISNVLKVAKLFTTTPETFYECIPFLLQNYGTTSADTTTNLYKALYTVLPDTHKYITLFTYFSYMRDRSRNTATFKAFFRTPIGITGGEVLTSTKEFRFNVTFNSDESTVGFLTPPQTTVLTEQLTAITNAFDEAIAITESNLTYDTDSWIPRIISLAIRYSRNSAVFYPVGNRDDFPVAWDWSTPANIASYLASNIRLKLSIREAGDRLHFKAIYDPTDRRRISTVLNYSANVLDYLPYEIKGPKEPKAPTYGVELEACGDYTAPQLIEAQKNLFFIAKADGSIYGNKQHCYELVTVPATLKAHKRLWAEFFEKIDYSKFDTSKDTGNGMHVHISRKAFSKSHLNRFTWFITNPGNEDFILAISERPTKRNMEEWARMPNHIHHPSKISAAKQASLSNAGIRGAVHYKRDITVEVRLFKGIVSYATIVKNLEFVDSVFEYTRTTMLSQLGLRNYVTWLNNTPKNKYQMLKTFLSEIKLADFMASSEITEYLWGTTADHIVVEKLNKAPFKITNVHITSLNKKRRKRTYILKEGKVLCVNATGGLLAKLDKSVQQKQTRGSTTFITNEIAA